MNKLLHKLQEREKAGNLRQLTVGKGRTDFFSNDYLGLARSLELANNITKQYTKYNGKVNGSTGSRLLAGNNRYFLELEERLAGIFNADKALIFNSGYNANLSVLSCIPQKGDTILYDELIHASLIDGARLSFARRYSFKHNDLQDLERLLQKSEGEKYIAVESVYSMDGDFAPLSELVELAEKHNAHIIVDEAHSTGVWGEGGKGLVCTLGLQTKILARIHTFGKAIGVHGACVVGSDLLIRYLINFARPFIYTTALPLHSLIAIDEAFKYLKKKDILQVQLREKINWFLKESKRLGCSAKLVASESPVQVLKVKGSENAKSLAEEIMDAGLDVRAILSPTVKAGEERLRICIHSFNKKEDITKLVGLICQNN